MILVGLTILVGVTSVILYRKFLSHFLSYVECTSEVKLTGKTVIVTGSNTGIGKETAQDLARRGARVILACRDVKKGENAAEEIRRQTGYNSQVKVMKLDLGSFTSVRKFAERFHQEEQRLDILVNNAGMVCNSHSLNEDGVEMTMAVNHMGPFLLTNLLLDKLKSCAPSRVVNVAALAHTWVTGMNFEDFNLDKSFRSVAAYARSKLANILFTRLLAKKLKDSGVTTYALHPGVIKTELSRNMRLVNLPGIKSVFETIAGKILLDARQGAQTTIFCCVSEDLEKESGKYYDNCAEAPISAAAADDVTAQRLWDLSEKMTGLVKQE